MIRIRSLRFLLIAAGCLASAAVASAQSKIAIINLQRAIIETAEIKKAQTAMEAKYKPRQQEMEKLQKELQDIQQQLQAMQGKLTPQAEQELAYQSQRKQRDLQRLGEDLQAEVDRDRNDILAKSSQRMRDVVKKLAEENGYDAVFDVSTTIFYKPALEITEQATSAFDKQYPGN